MIGRLVTTRKLRESGSMELGSFWLNAGFESKGCTSVDSTRERIRLFFKPVRPAQQITP